MSKNVRVETGRQGSKRPAGWSRLPAAILALACLAANLMPSQPALAQTGLLVNPDFEDGYFHQDAIPELAVPNGWRLYYLEGVGFPGIAEDYLAYRPETIVWYIKDAPAEERTVFFLNGEYTLKVFRPWAPMYAALAQEVSGLEPGAEYEWNANIFVDVVDHYVNGQKVPPDNEPEGVGLRLGVGPAEAAWRDDTRIAYSPWWTAGNTRPFHQTYLALRQRFTATSSRMMVWVEVASKFGYANNGFFMDAFSLRPVGQAPASPTPTPTLEAPSATPTAAASSVVPTATAAPLTTLEVPAPTATPAAPAATPGYVQYTIQRGDTLYNIARTYGVSVAQIAQLNNLANTTRIYPGQVIQIPVGGGQPALAPASPQPPVAQNAGSRTYVVRQGDTLYRIALAYGLTTAQLAAANGIADPRRIYPGQVIVIP